jgi:hypothetical protein
MSIYGARIPAGLDRLVFIAAFAAFNCSDRHPLREETILRSYLAGKLNDWVMPEPRSLP